MRLPGSSWGRLAGPFFWSSALALCLAASAAQAWEPFFSLDSFAHSEPVPVHAFVDDWDVPLESGSDALTHNWLETGLRHGAWSLGYLQRYDYEIKASRGAVELYHRASNKQDFAPGEHFDLSLDAWHVRLQGLRLAWRFEWDRWGRLETGASLFDAWKLTDGRVSGSATAQGPGDYDYEAQVDYVYSEDHLFERPTGAPGGEAFSLDARWTVPFAENWSFDLQARDLYGRVNWDQAPFTTARATSDTKEFDEDGYVRYTPTLSGREANRDYGQRLHPRALASLRWQALERHALSVRGRFTEVRHYASLIWDYPFGSHGQLQAEILADPLALGLKLGWRGLSLAWLADDLQPHRAHVLQLGLQAGWTF